ncbi:hypothetical protein [Algirhabdus cladophorae]
MKLLQGWSADSVQTSPSHRSYFADINARGTLASDDWPNAAL